MIRFSIALLAVAGALSATVAHAEPTFSKAAYEGAKEDIRSTFKAERQACGKLEAAAREVCVERTKGGEKVALARLQLNYTGSADDEFALYRVEYEARYEIDRQRCTQREGSDKDICVQQAKTERDKAKADATMARRINDAVADDARARLKADLALAREKCDALAGDVRDACRASAKARFSEGW